MRQRSDVRPRRRLTDGAANGLRSKLGKLKGRDLTELKVRGTQAASAYIERLGLSSQTREMSDDSLWRELDPSSGVASLAQTAGAAAARARLLERFRERAAAKFFESFTDREATLAALRHHFPRAESAAIARANGLLQGRFDLLGHRDLSFGQPIDWRFDPVLSRRAPAAHWSTIDYLDPTVAGDHKLVWELNRHQHFIVLGKAYWYTRDEAYAREFASQISGWMDANPPKIGINWASSLEISFRCIAWIWALHFFRESPVLTPDLFARVLKNLYSHARHLETYLSTYFSPNTHLTGEALGLVYIGSFFPEFRRAARWRRSGWSVLREQLARQVRPDGVYFEQASYYHRYTTDFYLHAFIIAECSDESVRGWMTTGLTGLLDHLMYITRPDGTTPLVGDDDGGRVLPLDDRAPNDFRSVLLTGAAVFSRPDYAFVAAAAETGNRVASEETLWLLGTGAIKRMQAMVPRPPSEVSRAFPDGGYFVMRDGWKRDSNYALIDCGPHGTMNCGHAHADALAVEVAVLGKTLFVDPGTYTYTASAQERDHFRSSAAHNTVTVDGESSSVTNGPFSWKHVASCRLKTWVSHERFDFFEGSHDGFERLQAPAVHTRSVLFIRNGYWMIRDRIESHGEHGVVVSFQCGLGLESGAASRESGAGSHDSRAFLISEAGGGAVAQVACFSAANGSFECGKGYVSPAYGIRIEAPRCTYSVRGAGTQDIITFIIPIVGRGSSSAERVSSDDAFVVTRESERDLLLLKPTAGSVEGAQSDGEWIWIRSEPGGGAKEFLILEGQSLTVNGDLLFEARDRVGCAYGRRESGGWVVTVLRTMGAGRAGEGG